MIDALQALLADVGYMAPGKRCPVNISFRRPIFIQLFPDAERSVVVKSAPSRSTTAEALKREYETLQIQARRDPSLVAAPLAFQLRDGHAFLVMADVEHAPTSIADLDIQRPGTVTLARFLVGSDEVEDKRQAPPPLMLEPALALLPDDLRGKLTALSSLRAWTAWQSTLPPRLQHSDLAINNIGRTPEGFVLFDWEDYGRIAFPGFDLAVLIASACDFDPARVNATLITIMQHQDRDRGVFEQAASGLPIPRERLPELMMISIVLFHGLKYTLEYGEDVIAKCRALLRALTQ